MKKLFGLLLLFTLLFTVSACGDKTEGTGEENKDGTTTISFFGWGSAEEQENFQTLINAFMEENEDVKVVYSASSSETYMNNLKNKGKNLPDVFYIPDYEFMQWADSGKLLALDEYMTQEEIDSMWDLSIDMYRYNRDEYKLGQGDLYGLPKDLGPYGIVYNKDLLKSLIETYELDIALPDPNIPMTWDEFVEYLKKITFIGDNKHNNKDIYGLGYYEMMAAVYSNNANYFDDKVKTQKITDPNFIQAIQWIADLDLVHHVTPTADQQSSQNAFQRFLNQGCVFTFMGPWDCKQFWNDLTFEFDIIPTPVGPAEGAKSTSWVGSVAYSINANTKKKDAAVKLVKFLACSERSNKMNYQLGQAIPNMKEIALGDYIEGVGLEGRQLMPDNRKLFVDIVQGNEHVQGKNRHRYYVYDNTCLEDLEANLTPVFQGRETAESFLTRYAPTYQTALDDSNAYLN